MHGNRGILSIFTVVMGLLSLAPPAHALTSTLRIHTEDTGRATIGLAPKEMVAVVFEANQADYPLKVQKVLVRTGAVLMSGHSGTGKYKVRIWNDTLPASADPAQASSFYSSDFITVQTGANILDISSDNATVQSGPFRVGLEVGLEGADVLVDRDGKTAGRNWIYGIEPGGQSGHWQEVPSLLPGDWHIAVEVETRHQADGGLPHDGGMPHDGGLSRDGGSPYDGGPGPDGGGSLYLTAIEPDYGYSNQPRNVTITGGGFGQGAEVLIGGFNADQVAHVNAGRLTAQVRSGLPPGIYDVMVKNPNQASATLQQAFRSLATGGTGCSCRTTEGSPHTGAVVLLIALILFLGRWRAGRLRRRK